MRNSESVEETMELTTEHPISEKDSDCKQYTKWYCLILFPVWFCIIVIYILLSLFIREQLNNYDSLHTKNITIIKPWINGTTVVKCNPSKPCYVTCDTYAYNSKECEFSFIWIILTSILLGMFSCIILCQICKYGCSYICYKCIHKKTTPTPTNKQYGRV